MINFRPHRLYPLERTAIPTEQEAVWVSVQNCRFMEKKKYFYATEIWTPEYQARSLVTIEKKNLEINAIIWIECDTMSFDIKVVLSTNRHGVIQLTIYKTTRCHIPHDSNYDNCDYEDLKCHTKERSFENVNIIKEIRCNYIREDIQADVNNDWKKKEEKIQGRDKSKHN